MTEPPRRPPEPLAICLFSDAPERAHYALVLAASAAAMARPVTVFIAGPAVGLLDRADHGAHAAFARTCARRGVATLDALRGHLAELGVRVLACETALRLHGIAEDRLDPAWGAEVAGAVSFLDAGRGGQTLVL